MSTPPSNRRPGQPERPSQASRGQRRREPLFSLEDDDIAPRRPPPRPLGDLVSDLDEALPVPTVPAARPVPARRSEPAPPRHSEPAPARRQAQPAPVDTRERPVAQRLRPAPPIPPPARVSQELRLARDAYDDAEADLHRIELLARPYGGLSRPAPPPLALPPWAIMLGVIVASLVVLITLGGVGGSRNGRVSRWSLPFLGQGTESAALAPLLAGPANPVGDYRLQGAPSISAEAIDRILASYGSPATGTGAAWYNLGLKYGIDPAFAVAFFVHESTAGTARNWAGLKPDGSTTHNVGNIICAGYATCYNRFRDYSSWEEGIEDWYRLIDREYIKGRGHSTVADVIPVYAPAFENNVQLYIDTVNHLVDKWRRGEVP